jgi:3-oxoacyl-[acyl-carrier-protein] synthase II
VLFIERLDDALARGAHVYGEIVGFGLTSDAHHMSAPRPDGTINAAAMRRALAEAGIEPDEVDVVNAHGSGTPLGDRSEALAISQVFAGRNIPVTATKGQHGHALGATGAWEAALTLLTFAHGIVPKTVNNTEDDPDCPIALTRAPIELAPRVVLSNSAGFGGINAALVFRRYE